MAVVISAIAIPFVIVCVVSIISSTCSSGNHLIFKVNLTAELIPEFSLGWENFKAQTGRSRVWNRYSSSYNVTASN